MKDFKVIKVSFFFIPDFNLLSFELNNFAFKILHLKCYIESFYIRSK